MNDEYEMMLSSFFGDYLISNIHVIITNFAVVFAGYYLIKLDLDGRERGAIILTRIRPLEPVIVLVSYLLYIAVPQGILFLSGFALFSWLTEGLVLNNPDNLIEFVIKILLTSFIIFFNTFTMGFFIACGFYSNLEVFAVIGLLSSFMLSLPSTFVLDKWGFPSLLLYFLAQILLSVLWLFLALVLGRRYYRAHKLVNKDS